MKFDHSMLTGLFLGLSIGLWYMDKLVAYLPFFIIAAVIYLMRYLHE